MFSDRYPNAKDCYKNSWLRFLLQYTALGRLLIEDVNPTSSLFFNTYFSSWWLTRLLFSWIIQGTSLLDTINAVSLLKTVSINDEAIFNKVSDYDVPASLASMLVKLHHAEILTQENKDALIAHARPSNLADAFLCLQRHRILTQANFDAVIKLAIPYDLPYAFSRLQEVEMLTDENRDAVIAHDRPSNLADAFLCLQRAEMLTDENRDAVIKHAYPSSLANAFLCLQRAEMLTDENRDAVIAHARPSNLADAFLSLQRRRILTDKNRAAVIKHAKPDYLADAFLWLQQDGGLTDENRDAIIAHTNPLGLAFAFARPQKAGMLTNENRDAVIAHASLDDLTFAFARLKDSRILTDENTDAVIKHANPDYLADAFSRLQQVGILTPENRRLVATYDSTVRLTFPENIKHTDAERISGSFYKMKLILIMTSNEAEYRRISALIPWKFRQFIQPFGLFAKIQREQLKVLNDVEVLSLLQTRLLELPFSLVYEYSQPFNKLMCQVPLPCSDDELPGYVETLQTVFNRYKQVAPITDKLHKLIDHAERAISTAKKGASQFNQVTLVEKQAQINAIKQLIKWLYDDAQILSTTAIALLGASRSVSLILEKNPLKLTKLSRLKDQLMATPGYQDWCYEQERRSLRQQQFLFRFERDCLSTNKDSTLENQEAFDRQFGIVPYSP